MEAHSGTKMKAHSWRFNMLFLQNLVESQKYSDLGPTKKMVGPNGDVINRNLLIRMYTLCLDSSKYVQWEFHFGPGSSGPKVWTGTCYLLNSSGLHDATPKVWGLKWSLRVSRSKFRVPDCMVLACPFCLAECRRQRKLQPLTHLILTFSLEDMIHLYMGLSENRGTTMYHKMW